MSATGSRGAARSPTRCSTRATCSTRTGVGAEEPGALAVRCARAPSLRGGDGLGTRVVPHRVRRRSRRRTAAECAGPLPPGAAAHGRGSRCRAIGFAEVDELDVDGERFLPWDEAVEHEIDLPLRTLPRADAARTVPVQLDGADTVEDLRAASGELVGPDPPPTASRSTRRARHAPTGPTASGRCSRSRSA